MWVKQVFTLLRIGLIDLRCPLADWLSGWLKGWVNALIERTNERMNRWIDEWMIHGHTERLNDCIDWTNERTNEGMDEWMNGWMNGWYMDTRPWKLRTGIKVFQFCAIGIYQLDTRKLSCALGQWSQLPLSGDKGIEVNINTFNAAKYCAISSSIFKDAIQKYDPELLIGEETFYWIFQSSLCLPMA